MLTTLICIAVLGGLAVIGVYSFETESKKNKPVNVETVRAKKGPTKIKPKDPGGMVIPHQDKSIYSRLEPGGQREKIEDLLLAPELENSRQTTNTTKENVIRRVRKNNTGAIIENKKEKQIYSIKKNDDKQEELAVNKNKKIFKSTKKSGIVLKKGYRVQIASLKSQKNVNKIILRLRSKYPELVKGLKFFIVRAKIKGKGTYYRLQVGHLKRLEFSKVLCKKFKSLKLGCFIVRL
tara:strand:+ start:3290 stop:3997 length:708 start_codon:yes stop_codon:yes gene_type:complete